MGGVFDFAINSSFSLMSSRSFGYSSNLSASPGETAALQSACTTAAPGSHKAMSRPRDADPARPPFPLGPFGERRL